MKRGRPQRKGRLTLALLLGAPLGLLLIAWLIYTTGFGIPQSTHNYGILLKRPFHVAPGLPLHERGWTLLLPVAGPCDEACKGRLHRTRQAHAALGRDAGRLRRLHWATREAPAAEEREFLRREHPGLQTLHQPAPVEWMERIREEAAIRRWGDHFYLVDQRGFLMMAYPNSESGKGLLEDLRFLFRISPRN